MQPSSLGHMPLAKVFEIVMHSMSPLSIEHRTLLTCPGTIVSFQHWLAASPTHPPTRTASGTPPLTGHQAPSYLWRFPTAPPRPLRKPPLQRSDSFLIKTARNCTTSTVSPEVFPRPTSPPRAQRRLQKCPGSLIPPPGATLPTPSQDTSPASLLSETRESYSSLLFLPVRKRWPK